MSRRPLVVAVSRRPAGPRCHGGASSLLRLGAAVVAPRVAPAAASGWNDLDDASAVEHVVRRPLCAPGAVFWS
ncbi:MAG: hypothetical protein ACXWZ7_20680 [Gemmatirosa sp.]